MNKNSKRKHSLYFSMLVLTIVPLLVLGLIIVLSASKRFKKVMYDEVKEELRQAAGSIEMIYDNLHPGTYFLSEDGKVLFKGNDKISGDNTVVDRFKENNNIEVTIFYGNVRYITTIADESHKRETGTDARIRVYKKILETKEAQFYDSAYIYGVKYFAYYKPVFNDKNEVIGMTGVAKSAIEVDKMINKAIYPIIILAILMTIVAGAVTVGYSKSIIDNIIKIQMFLSKVAKGNLSCKVPESVALRNDELGDIAVLAENMQMSIKNLVEHDALTGILNRGCGEKRLKQICHKYLQENKTFSVAIGDIDFFKSVNDTYGHETGDVVLKIVSETIENTIEGKGFVCRWGGEEFLIIFENLNKQAAASVLEKVRENIKNKQFEINGNTLSVTMTFGICESDNYSGYTEIVSAADELLYKGKENGRDCIVTE